MQILFSLVLLFLFATDLRAQANPGDARTQGICSPAVTGNDNKFVIHCDIGAKSGIEVIALLNRILANQKQEDTDHKIDLILKFVSEGMKLPRRIQEIDKPKLIAILRSNPSRVRICALMSDKESNDFAADWYNVFIRANWEIVEQRITPMLLTPPLAGVQMSFKDSISTDPTHYFSTHSDNASVLLITKALEAYGIEPEPMSGRPALEKDTVNLIIGEHP